MFQNLTTFGLLAIFGIFATLGFFRGSPANLPPLFADDLGLAGTLLSTLTVLQIVPYFLTGFETIPKCSEEAAARLPTTRLYPGICSLAVDRTLFST